MGEEAVAEPDELGSPAGPSGPAQPQSASAGDGSGGGGVFDAGGRGVVVVEEPVEADVAEAAAKVAVVGLVPRLEVPCGNFS